MFFGGRNRGGGSSLPRPLPTLPVTHAAAAIQGGVAIISGEASA
jgi:hypothetical protein